MSKYNFKIEAGEQRGFFKFRIVETNSGKKSCKAPYESIAVLEIDGKFFGAVTNYYYGQLPVETVFEIIPQTTKVMPEGDVSDDFFI